MIRRIHHIGLAVDDLDQAITLYQGLGATLLRRGEQESEAMAYALLHAGHSELELMTSSDPESAVGKFLARRGQGVHHVAYAVPDVAAAAALLSGSGYELVGSVRTGLHGTPIAFLHPRSMDGVLTELVQED